MDQIRVARMRQLLSEASTVMPDAVFIGIAFRPSEPMRGNLKRRAVIKQLQLAVKHYDLQLDIDACLAVAGRASLSGLDDQQLGALSRWVSGVMDRLSIAADSPDSPPAR